MMIVYMLLKKKQKIQEFHKVTLLREEELILNKNHLFIGKILKLEVIYLFLEKILKFALLINSLLNFILEMVMF